MLQSAAVAEQHLELSERFAEVLGNLRQARRQLRGEMIKRTLIVLLRTRRERGLRINRER